MLHHSWACSDLSGETPYEYLQVYNKKVFKELI